MHDTKPSGPTLLQWALAIILSIGFVMMASLAIKDLLVPPFAAADVHENIVDTWEAYALGYAALMLGVAALTILGAIVAMRTHSNARKLYLGVTILGGIALGLMALAYQATSGIGATH